VDDEINATRAAVEEGSYPGRHHQQQRPIRRPATTISPIWAASGRKPSSMSLAMVAEARRSSTPGRQLLCAPGWTAKRRARPAVTTKASPASRTASPWFSPAIASAGVRQYPTSRWRLGRADVLLCEYLKWGFSLGVALRRRDLITLLGGLVATHLITLDVAERAQRSSNELLVGARAC
jgi:hypothetical protein